jgi:hypothetical protein
MATTLKMAAKNTAPYWQITCQRDGTAINLTGCTVTLIIAKGATVTQTAGPCTITSAAAGIIRYTPTATDIPSAGSYKVDVKVNYSDGTYEVLYEQLKVKARKTIN